MKAASVNAERPFDYAQAAMPLIYPVWRRGKYALGADYTFEVDGKTFVIKAGFTFDGASVPRFFWRIVTPFSPYVIRAALLHDWLYQHHVLTRARADALLREVLIEDGVSPLVARAMYRAVRVFGAKAYR